IRDSTAVIQCEPKAAMRLRIGALAKLYRLAELFYRFIKLALTVQCQPEIVERIGVLVAVRNSLTIQAERGIQFTLSCEGVTQIPIGVGILIARQLDRLLVSADCFVDLSARVVCVTKVIERLGIFAVALLNRFAKGVDRIIGPSKVIKRRAEV